MNCGFCELGQLRLVGFVNGRERLACRSCGQETALLDCDLCERRSVRRLQDAGDGGQRWACNHCRVVKAACPACGRGWLEAGACGRCGHCAA